MANDRRAEYLAKFTGHKTTNQQRLLNEALDILQQLGFDVMEETDRKREKMALSLACLAGVTKAGTWKNASNSNEFTTKEIIDYVNKHFNENISKGSYDYIKRHGLDRTKDAGIINSTKPNSSFSDSTRAYAISAAYLPAIRSYGSPAWKDASAQIIAERGRHQDSLKPKRTVTAEIVDLPSSIERLGTSPHDSLIREVLVNFLPRFGSGAEPLYFGNGEQRVLHLVEKTLKELQFFELGPRELPDVVAFSRRKNWVYLVEAVYSRGHMDADKVLRYKRLLEDCPADLIFITAFPDRRTFARHAVSIAWETEVWIANDRDHLIHFNGDKFLGPCGKLPG